MACQKCIEAGTLKTIHYARQGRWETRIYCKHSYSGARLQDNEHNEGLKGRKRIKHVLSKDKAGRVESRETKKPRCERVEYTDEMDAFIMLHYTSGRQRLGRQPNKHGAVKDVVKLVAEKFGLVLTENQVIGRWWRLMKQEEKRIASQPRQVPSLPVLKFMQGWGA